MALNRQKLIDDLKAAFKAPDSITGPKDPPGKQQELQAVEYRCGVRWRTGS